MIREDGAENDVSRRRRPRRKRRRLNPRVVPVMFALLLFILIGGFAAGRFLYQKYSPSKEMADLNEYFGLESDQDMAVVVNQENVGDMARLIDGKIYATILPGDRKSVVSALLYFRSPGSIVVDESITGTRHGQKGNTNRGGGCRAWRS